MKFEERNVSDLKHHPLNPTIYGHNEDISDLVAHYERSKRIDPVGINQRDEVIDGNRRLDLAIRLGIKTLTTYLRSFSSEAEELEAILSANAHRDKSKLQKIREGMAWEQILSGGAKDKSLANLKGKKSGQNLAPREGKGKTRDEVAKLVGLGSGYNYIKGRDVVQAYDKLKGEKHPEAEVLLEALDNSIDAAYKLLKEFEARLAASVLEGVSYYYQGETVAGGTRDLEKGMQVVTSTSISNSDPEIVWVHLADDNDSNESFKIHRDNLDMVQAREVWRDRTNYSLCSTPGGSTVHLYVRCDNLPVNQQVAYSVHRELGLGKELESLNREYSSAEKKQKEKIKQRVDIILHDMHTERSMQRTLTKKDGYDATEVRSLREELRLKARELGLPANSTQVLPDVKRNEGDPSALVNDTPLATPGLVEEKFKLLDRVALNTKMCLATVHLRSPESIKIRFDDGIELDLSRTSEDFNSLQLVTAPEEWRIYQKFTRRVFKFTGGSDLIECTYTPDLKGSPSVFNRFDFVGSVLVTGSEYKYLGQSEINDLLPNNVTPIVYAQTLLDDLCRVQQNNEQNNADSPDEKEDEEGQDEVLPEEGQGETSASDADTSASQPSTIESAKIEAVTEDQKEENSVLSTSRIKIGDRVRVTDKQPPYLLPELSYLRCNSGTIVAINGTKCKISFDATKNYASHAAELEQEVIELLPKKEPVRLLSQCGTATDIDWLSDSIGWEGIARQFLMMTPNFRRKIYSIYPGIYELLQRFGEVDTRSRGFIDFAAMKQADDVLNVGFKNDYLPKDIMEAISICLGEGDWKIINSLNDTFEGNIFADLTYAKSMPSWLKKLREEQANQAIARFPINFGIFHQTNFSIVCILRQDCGMNECMVYLGDQPQVFHKLFENFGAVWHRA